MLIQFETGKRTDQEWQWHTDYSHHLVSMGEIGSKTTGALSPLQITKSLDAPVSSIKWHKTMHPVSPPHSWIPKYRLEILFLTKGWLNTQMQNLGIHRTTVFIEKSPHISGPTEFKPVLFKGQLYIKVHSASSIMFNS